MRTARPMRMEVQKTTVALVVIGCDVMGCALFLMMVWWLKIKQADEVERVDANTVTVEDYTLMICNMPRDQGTDISQLREDLKEHIERRINHPDAKEKAALRYGEKAGKDDCVIDQIHFGLNNHKLISKLKARVEWEKRLIRYKRKLKTLHKLAKAGNKKHSQRTTNRAYTSSLTRVQKRLKKIDERLMGLINSLEANPENIVQIETKH